MNEDFNAAREKAVLCETEHPAELSAWFSVFGDTEDFIFYDAPDRIVSEK